MKDNTNAKIEEISMGFKMKKVKRTKVTIRIILATLLKDFSSIIVSFIKKKDFCIYKGF